MHHAGMGAELANCFLVATTASDDRSPCQSGRTVSRECLVALHSRGGHAGAEAVSAAGIRPGEVLLFDAPLDVLVVETLREFKGRSLVNLAAEGAEKESPPATERKGPRRRRNTPTSLSVSGRYFGDRVAGVRFSATLTENPV